MSRLFIGIEPSLASLRRIKILCGEITPIEFPMDTIGNIHPSHWLGGSDLDKDASNHGDWYVDHAKAGRELFQIRPGAVRPDRGI
jgi:hypothetical protein